MKTAQAAGQPVISVDTKKKELVGDFKNAGKEWQPSGAPEAVRVHDFPIPSLGKVAPYGVYDVTHNLGWVNVGIDHDTAAGYTTGNRKKQDRCLEISQDSCSRYPPAISLLAGDRTRCGSVPGIGPLAHGVIGPNVSQYSALYPQPPLR